MNQNDVLMYDTVSRKWEDLSPSVSGSVPSPRSNFGFATIGDSFYIYGGWTGTWGAHRLLRLHFAFALAREA